MCVCSVLRLSVCRCGLVFLGALGCTTVFPLLVVVLLRLSHVYVQLRYVSSAYGHSKMATDKDGSEVSLTLPQPTCLSAHQCPRRSPLDIERSFGSWTDTAHVGPFLREMVVLRSHRDRSSRPRSHGRWQRCGRSSQLLCSVSSQGQGAHDDFLFDVRRRLSGAHWRCGGFRPGAWQEHHQPPCGPASRIIPVIRISPSILTMCRGASIPFATGLRSPRPPRTSRRLPLRAQATGSQTDTAAHFVLGQTFSARETSDGEVHHMCSLPQAGPCVDRCRLRSRQTPSSTRV